ncbi:hypothetical protein HCN44_001124 [Aphidius gifuensis]|uniref:Septin n=1 Tax=Aphidius gifuensis TaxID=684658 RepID=A0A834XM59_APHGI|nr:septin-2-like [Aphidius gifuensis]KAF7988551.1 hypothetical protein HCN44_001124 [Aphidius gifuensis]
MKNTTRNMVLTGHVGFSSLPDQLVAKSIDAGFTFNILCIGETGLGKSTLIDSLFNTTFDSTPSPHNLPTDSIKCETYQLQENNVNLKLKIVDTVGYGDQINKINSSKSIVDFIDEQFNNYLQEELKVDRSMSTYDDTRIHACLYFICPTGHGLKALDILCMKKIHKKVNIIPIIAKADTISKIELQDFKNKIISELESSDINIYKFPIDDDNIADVNMEMNKHVPFAVVGSNDLSKIGNKMARSRKYPWGTIQIENEKHCDFVKLREMLIRINMQDMIEKTNQQHYELYRMEYLKKIGFEDSENKQPLNFQGFIEQKKIDHEMELDRISEQLKERICERIIDFDHEQQKFQNELNVKVREMSLRHTVEREKVEEHMKILDNEIQEFNRVKEQKLKEQLSPGRQKIKKK